MPKIYIVTVGRIKTKFWQDAALHYRLRLERAHQLDVAVIKDAASSLQAEARKKQEGARILDSMPSGATWVCLDEHGVSMTSKDFAAYVKKMWDSARPPCFIVGGSYGLSDEVLEKAHKKISFGPMTLPHELAQVMLWEQLFRADSILRKTGYHHE